MWKSFEMGDQVRLYYKLKLLKNSERQETKASIK